MSDLIILMPTKSDDPWEWGLTEKGEWGNPKSDADKSALSSLPYTRLIAVLPGTEVITKLHTLEDLKEKQRIQAAGFSIEDDLAASLEDTHIAFDPNASRMAICSNDRIEQTIAELVKHGMTPDIICADYDCFGSDISFEYNGRIVSQSASGIGFAVETGMASAFLSKDQGIPSQISPQRIFENIANSFKSGHSPINLRQGKYAKRTKLGGARFKRLAALAAALVIAFLALNIGPGLNYSNKTSTLKSEINSIYTELFPDTAVPENPVLPVLRAQSDRNGSSSSDFVALSSILAQSLREIDGIEISSLRYDKARGQLNLSILYGSFEDTEKLKAAVHNNGGSFTEGGTRQSGEGLTGEAVLRAGV